MIVKDRQNSLEDLEFFYNRLCILINHINHINPSSSKCMRSSERKDSISHKKFDKSNIALNETD